MASIGKASDGMVENIQFTERKKEGAVDGALENPSVRISIVDEEVTYRGAQKGKIMHTECPQPNNMYFQCTHSLHLRHSYLAQLRSFICLFNVFHGILARLITPWSLIRPRKKRLKMPISFTYYRVEA